MVFEKLKNDIIDNFMISKEMKDYLHTVDLSDRNLFEIMAGSLESLEVKLEWIRQLNDACEGKYNEQYFKLKNAIDKLHSDDGALFLVTMHWMDLDIKEEKRGAAEPCSSFEEVKRYIGKAILDDFNYPEIPPEDDYGWFEVEKWDKDTDGFRLSCTYYMIGSKTVFFKPQMPKGWKPGSLIYTKTDNGGIWSRPLFSGYDTTFCDSENLNLPVPFDRGELVNIDCRPVHQSKPALILTRGDNKDCCSLQALAIDEDGEFMQGAVKHTSLFSIRTTGHFGVSPLYRMETYKKECCGDKENLLKSIGEDIKEHGRKVGL